MAEAPPKRRSPHAGITIGTQGVTKQGTIFRVPLPLIVEALKAIRAIPGDAVCLAQQQELAIKAYSYCLPVVPEGALFPVRKAKRGSPRGVPE